MLRCLETIGKGGIQLRKKTYKKTSARKPVISILLCIFLVATSLSSMIGASINTSERLVRNHSNDETNYLTYTFSFREPELKQTTLYGASYSKIVLSGAMNMGKKAGEPAMPTSFVKILLPLMKTVRSIQINGDPVEIDTQVDLTKQPVIPYQYMVPIGQTPPSDVMLDAEVYCSSETYPAEPYEKLDVGYCRGYAILTVALNPVQYLPADGMLFYYPEMTVDIELEDTEYINEFYRNNIDDEEWVTKLVVNPEIAKSYTTDTPTFSYPGGLCDPSDAYDYVIITTIQNGLDYWPTNSSTPYNWESLMDKHEQDDGLSCTLVTIEDIDACTDYHDPDPLFDDLEAHIREFCKDAYQDWGTDYIFIGGDDEWIPAREMNTSYEAYIDSDIYWSNLDNNFNADHDCAWGEEEDGGFDLYSEIFIGRITCDEPQDVSNWMTKSFYYADNLNQDYLENAAFYGGILGWDCQSDDFIDYSAIKGTNNWIGPEPGAHGPYPSWLGFHYGFETWNSNNPEIKYNLSVKWTAESPNPGWQGGNESASVNGLRNDINNDQVTLISAVAHADSHMSMDVTDSVWESEYHNTKPFFLHDFGCHCGDMDAADDGVLHSMLFHSDTELAFACVYNTCYGWGSFDDTNSSSALQMKLFWDYIFDTQNNSGCLYQWELGKAMAWSKDSMAPTINWTYTNAPGSWRAVIQGCLLFGDPAQKIKPSVRHDHNVGIQKLDVGLYEPTDTDIWVGATLFNNGLNNETGVEVRFLVDDVEQNTTIISLFEHNTIEEVGWMYHTPSYGQETLCVSVTPVLYENITSDNVRCREVIYGPDIAVSEIQAPSCLGIGYGQPVKGFIENLGVTDETVTVDLIANNILVNTTNVYLPSGSSIWVTFMWDGTISGEGTYDVTVHAEPVPGEYYLFNQNKSSTVTVFSVIGNVLLVDDDKGNSYESWYKDAIMASHYVYDVWDRSNQPSPTPSVMQQYDAVIWFTGCDFSETLLSEDQDNLASYLDNGGRLFISGQTIGYDIYDSSFYSDYMHAEYLINTAGEEVEGVDGDEIGDGLSFNITGGDGASNQYWPDGIAPISPATSCFFYSDAPLYKGGIKVVTNGYQIVYLSFGFEGIDNMDDRTSVMSRSLLWLCNLTDENPPSTSHVFNGTMGENGWYISCVTVELTAYDDIFGVLATYYCLDGGDWTVYSEPFEVCEDGEHTLEYYSVDYVGNEEDVNGPFDFKIDHTIPTIELTAEKTDTDTWLLIATVSDETTGIANVEFYVDDEFIGEVTEAPFEWEYAGSGSEAYAIAYDNAGNSATSAKVDCQSQIQSMEVEQKFFFRQVVSLFRNH